MHDEPTCFDFRSTGGVTLAAYRWDAIGEPRAIVQVAHGVGEYARRYAPLIDSLTDAGFVVYSHDHRGHGASVARPEELGVLGETGWGELVADIGRIGQHARDEHPSLKLGLVAHSLGSFATQQYLLDDSASVNAVVLSGTAAIDLLEPMLDLNEPMDLAMFNAAFAPARTDFDWLSRDDEQVDRYIADPLCGFGLDIPGAKAMFAAARALADASRVSAMRPDLPIHIVVGEMDPVNGQLALVNALVDRYRQAGSHDVSLRVFPGARHEVFNETNRAEVFADVVDWLSKALAQ